LRACGAESCMLQPDGREPMSEMRRNTKTQLTKRKRVRIENSF
jgi:hypothetical protein